MPNFNFPACLETLIGSAQLGSLKKTGQINDPPPFIGKVTGYRQRGEQGRTIGGSVVISLSY